MVAVLRDVFEIRRVGVVIVLRDPGTSAAVVSGQKAKKTVGRERKMRLMRFG